MDKGKLDNSKALAELQKAIEETRNKLSHSSYRASYRAPAEVKKAAHDPLGQKLKHRNILLWLVIGLSCSSFIFLVLIIGFQMYIRLCLPEYNGVSDTVINIVAVSVFAQVIAVVATISKLVFKD